MRVQPWIEQLRYRKKKNAPNERRSAFICGSFSVVSNTLPKTKANSSPFIVLSLCSALPRNIVTTRA